MTRRSYSFEKDGPPRVHLTWTGVFKHVQLDIDGQVIGIIEDGKALKDGHDFALGDGTAIRLKLVPGIAVAGFEVTRSGVPLFKTAEPEDRLHLTTNAIFLIAGMNLAFGLIAVLFQNHTLIHLGFDLPSVALGMLFVMLGIMVRDYKSTAALSIMVAIYVLDGIFSIALGIAETTGRPPLIGIVVRSILFLPLLRGFLILRGLRRLNRSVSA